MSAGDIESRNNRPVKVLVVGAGAIGSFYGGKLAQAGAEVSVVCRSDYDVVKEKGFVIKSILGDFRFMPHRVLKNAEDYGDRADYILVTLKVLPDINRVELIRPAVYDDTSIVLLQNGVDIEKPVAEAYPDNEVISGLAFICVNRTAPGETSHLDYGRLVIGVYPEGKSEKTRVLADLFKKSGILCREDDNIVKARWQKLIWNAPFNPISVLGGGIDTEIILEQEETALLARRVMEEVRAIAASEGHMLEESVVDQNINDTIRMKPYKTSMLLDYEAGRPMEVEAILGNAVRIARKNGVFACHMQTLYALLKSVDTNNRIPVSEKGYSCCRTADDN